MSNTSAPATAFALIITPEPGDFDALNHVNNAVWVRWIEQVSTAHWNAAASAEQIAVYQWVITRHEVDYVGNIAAGESVTARTWLGIAPRGARYDRHVDFTGADGHVKCRAITTWALTDRATGQLLRVRGDIIARFPPTP